LNHDKASANGTSVPGDRAGDGQYLYRIECPLPKHIRPIIEEKEYPYQMREVVSVHMFPLIRWKLLYHSLSF